MDVREHIITNLLKIEAIKLRPRDPFVWASGLYSPIYCDNRLSLSYPEIRKYVVQGFELLISKYDKPDIIIGVATAGIAHGALLAHVLDLPFAYVRSKKKAHGRQNAIEGQVQAEQSAIVIEDLISTGGSSIAAAQVLQEEGVKVQAILSIFNYNLQSSKDNFQNANIPFASICDYALLMEIAKKDASFSDADVELLRKWSHDPKAWSDSFQNQ